ncbi:MAG: hypothetical protein HGA19_17650, partial [Oscillochloris sp.]|nr:hypothetical protein [Oscillochloris sp.]
GRGLGRASYQGFLQRIDAIAITVLLQKRPTAGYDGPLLRAVELLLGQLYSRYWIDDSAIHRVVPNPHGVAHVVPYVLPHAPKLPY